MALCATSLRMFMRHSELTNVCRHMECVSFWKRMPATPLLMTEWISRRQAYYSTDSSDDSYKQGQKTNNVKASESKSGTPKSSTSSPTTTKSTKTAETTTTAKTLKAKNANTAKSSMNINTSTNTEPVFEMKASYLSKDLTHMKIAQLKNELRAHGLIVSGSKTVLMERLQNYLQQQQKEEEKLQEQQSTENAENSFIKQLTQNTALMGAATLSNSETTLSYNTSNSSSACPTSCTTLATTRKPSFGRTNTDTVTTYINHFTLSTASSAHSNQKHDDVSVEYIRGLPYFTIPLPSRNEKCQFSLKPVTHHVGDLINTLKIEDRGIDRAVVLNEAGVRVSSTCNIESLLDAPFWLHINDKKYKITPPKRDRIDFGDINKLGDIRILVAQLYEALNVGEYHLQKEYEMKSKLEDLKYKVAPLERKFEELNTQASRKTSSLMWVGLGFMSVQFGVIARLTWWEYSWDIMEPVTYFVTYGTTMAMFAYFCITKTEYNMPEVKERQYLLDIHKRAKRANFDIDGYNNLKRQIAEIEYNLRRLHDPLNVQLPPHVERSQEYPPPVTPPESSTPLASSSLSSSSSSPSLVATRQSKDGGN